MKTLKFPPDRRNPYKAYFNLDDYNLAPKKLRIYLCIPYTGMHLLSYKVANEQAAILMEAGHVVFSPISHSHSIGKCVDVKNHTHEFWMDKDLPFVDWCDELHVVIFPGNGHELIDKSRGCQTEIARAKQLGKPIKTILL